MLIASIAGLAGAVTFSTLAIVVQDQAQLRAAPRDSAQQQALLWQGDAVEIRGERMDYVQVYDHRRERGGYIRASQVRKLPATTADARDLLAVVRFLRDTPGAEALGIGYAAAFLKAAPVEQIDAEAFDALGTMAERLARRASARQGKANDAALAAHLEVAASYGVTLKGFERDGRMQLCYDGEAFRRVLALQSSGEQRARAALALTKQECIDPATPPVERSALDTWRADVLERADTASLPGHLKNRVRMRRAGVWAGIAYQRARRGEAGQAAANRALEELAGVNKLELTEDDAAAYAEAALRVGASRWAAEPQTAPGAGLAVLTRPGQPGETCVSLVDGKHDGAAPLLQKCTYGVVWTASASANAQGTALTLAVQPLENWREMWVFRKAGQANGGWRVDVLTPNATAPELGYLEFAGWVPGAAKLLAARESKVDGRFKRSFEVLDLATLEAEKEKEQGGASKLFRKWQDAGWKRGTVSLR